MKILVIWLALLVTSTALATELSIKIKNVKKDRGTIYIGIYEKKENWPGGEPNYELSTPAKSPETVAVIHLPEGEYGISLYQDVNDNNKMDYGMFRRPKEPWGVSNDAPARFGPPSWERMLIQIGSEPLSTEINLND